MRFAVLAAGAACVTLTSSLDAQELRARCGSAASQGWLDYCEALADAATTLPARVGIVTLGGNPVAGTASTIGMRLPGRPRVSTTLRLTAARAELPNPGGDAAIEPTLGSISADAAIALFNGLRILPTIGGFGSIDLLGSAGVLHITDDAFEGSAVFTWALGARLGILRESFTAPGVTLSAMYRRVPDVEFGDSVTGPWFENSGQRVVSLRGTVGKRVLGIGLTGGVGYDRHTVDVRAMYQEPSVILVPRVVSVRQDDVESSRLVYFGNASYTFMILHLTAELGWQEHGDRPTGARQGTGRGGLFAGIAARLAI